MASEQSKAQAKKQEDDRDLIAMIALAACDDLLHAVAASVHSLDFKKALTDAIRKLQGVLTESGAAAFTRARNRFAEYFEKSVRGNPQMEGYVGEQVLEAIRRRGEEIPQEGEGPLRDKLTQIAKDMTETLLAFVVGHFSGPDKTAAERTAVLEKMGLLGTHFLIQSLLDTFTHDAYSQGVVAESEEPAYREIFKGFEYVSMRDNRVRPRHREEDGKFAPQGDSAMLAEFMSLLSDWGCRCTLVPIFGLPHATAKLI